MNKPNFFIVGAAKAGTTSLHYYLSKHPDVYVSPIKEPNYFCKDICVDGFNPYMKRKFSNGGVLFDKSNNVISKHQAYISDEKTYLKLFANTNNQKMLGEASVSYLYSEVAAAEIYKFSPTAKIIIVLREPVDRAFSQYLANRRVGSVFGNNFLDIVVSDYNKTIKGWGNTHLYIELGQYYKQIRRFYDVFEKENILLLKYDDLSLDTIASVNRICSFLNVEEDVIHINNIRRNSAKVPINRLVAQLNKQSILKNTFRNIIPGSIINYLKKRSFSDKKLPTLKPFEKEALSIYFSKDIKDLQYLTKLSFDDWYA